jgi:hypothetical protein
MGYSTSFDGRLDFASDITVKQLSKIKEFLGEDCREHPEWKNIDLTYIDLELTDDLLGLKWDGSEKTYDLDKKINLIIEQLQKEFPDFELQGELMAQGEEVEDRYKIVIENNIAKIVDIPITGQRVVCPHCEEPFILE